MIIVRETGEALAAAVAINLALVAPWVKLLPSERALFRAEFVHHPWERKTVRECSGEGDLPPLFALM